jgi:hypothetical protein
MRDKNAKLTRWSLELMDYDYQVVHKPGKQHVPDALSRYPLPY